MGTATLQVASRLASASDSSAWAFARTDRSVLGGRVATGRFRNYDYLQRCDEEAHLLCLEQ